MKWLLENPEEMKNVHFIFGVYSFSQYFHKEYMTDSDPDLKIDKELNYLPRIFRQIITKAQTLDKAQIKEIIEKLQKITPLIKYIRP